MQNLRDPNTLEGAHKLYAALGETERGELNMLHDQVRAFVRQTLETVKALPEATYQRTGLTSLHQGAADLLRSITEASYNSALAEKSVGPVACAKGCAFCCYLSVEATIPAAVTMAAYVETARPDLKAGIVSAAPQVAGLTQAQRVAKQVPCPYLRDNACQAYAVRPLSCQSHASFDRQACETDRASGGVTGNIPVYGLPRVLSAMIVGGMCAAAADLGLQSCVVELIGATALVLTDPTAVPRWLAGESVFTPFQR